ncbi:MAG: hypothetical protein HYZ07_00735 [Candidatus Harrisonbacteria bacterium]|nr:hypothetical protein [Candidatus Harrisonbacteria bacterium]
MSESLAGYREFAAPIFGGSRSSGPEIGAKKQTKQVARAKEATREVGGMIRKRLAKK